MENSTNLLHSRENIFYAYLILMSTITIAGVFGNILVLVVVARFSTMQSVTNIQIFSLAVADLLHLLAVPQLLLTIKGYSFLPSQVACILYCFISHVNWFAGTLTLATMSADRFLAVIYPLRSHSFRVRKNAVIIVILVWIIATILMIPTFINAKLDRRNDSKILCIQKWPTYSAGMALLPTISYTFFFGYALPSCLILTFYSAILFRLRQIKRKSTIRSRTSRTANRTTLLVFIIVISFMLCNLPYWINQWRIIIPYKYIVDKRDVVQELLSKKMFNHTLVDEYFDNIKSYDAQVGFYGIMKTHFSQMAGFLNSALNPILYSFVSAQFRISFLAVVTGKCFGYVHIAADPRSNTRGNSIRTKTCNKLISENNKNKTVIKYEEEKPFELLDTAL